MVAFHERTIERGAAAGSVPTSPAAWESQAPPGSTVTREAASRTDRRGSPGAGGVETEGHARKSMSGVLIKEWSAFVLKEVRARKKVEAQMLALREEMQGMLATVRGDIDRAARGMDRQRGVLRRATFATRSSEERREPVPARGGDGEEDVRSTMDGFGVRSLARRGCGEAASSRRGESSDGADHALAPASPPLVDRQGA